MIVTIDLEEPESWLVYRVADVIREGGLAIVPTDTGYGFCCDIHNRAAVEKLYRVKNIDRKKPLGLLVRDIQEAATYTAGIPNWAFRIMKRGTPGPYTFILTASKQIPRMMLSKQRTVGVRIPDAQLIILLTEQLTNALVTSSVPIQRIEALYDPAEIEQRYGKEVDVIVDGGICPVNPSTVIDFTGRDVEVIREGAGSLDIL